MNRIKNPYSHHWSRLTKLAVTKCPLLGEGIPVLEDACDNENYHRGMIRITDVLDTIGHAAISMSKNPQVQDANNKKMKQKIEEYTNDDSELQQLIAEYQKRQFISGQPNKDEMYNVKIQYPSEFYILMGCPLKCHTPRHTFARFRINSHTEARPLMNNLKLKHKLIMCTLIRLYDIFDVYFMSPYIYIPIPSVTGGLHYKHNTVDESLQFYQQNVKPNANKRKRYNTMIATNQNRNEQLGSFVDSNHKRRSHRFIKQNSKTKESVDAGNIEDIIIPPTPPSTVKRWEKEGCTPSDLALLRAAAANSQTKQKSQRDAYMPTARRTLFA